MLRDAFSGDSETISLVLSRPRSSLTTREIMSRAAAHSQEFPSFCLICGNREMRKKLQLERLPHSAFS
jgi:hypothetical protein